LIRKELHRQGWRYRIDRRPLQSLRRTADIVFPSARLAVFVDGCFWHGCPTHSRDTKSNTKWWAEKIAANRQRDVETIALLEEHGWEALRVWEHEDPMAAAGRIAEILRSDGSQERAS
jgi:DNA mismatch endonuclease (patch repair protein)